MNSFEPYICGSNRWLSIGWGLLVVSFAIVAAGPAATYRASLRAEHELHQNELRRAEAQIRAFEPIADDALKAWSAKFDDLARWLAPAGDAADRLVEVAELFEGPTTRSLQVQPGVALDRRAPPLDLEMPLTVVDPARGAPLAIVAVPLSVRFRTTYPALSSALRRFEDRETPALVESVSIRREIDVLRVELDLVLLAREENAP